METETVTETPKPEAQTQTTEAPVTPEVKAFDPSTLSKDIQDYVETQKSEVSKKYADYDQRVQQAREWEQVRNDPRFQQFQQSLNAPQTPKPFEIDDDRFTRALTDKGEFTRLIQEAAKNLLETQVGPQLQHTQQQIQFQNKVAEIQQVVAKYPDFKDLDKKGLIEPLIRKYPNLSFEDSYKIAKSETFNEEVDKKARGVVEQKKIANVERGNNSSASRGAKVKVSSRLEAMELAGEAFRAGRPIPEFEDGD